MMKNMLLAAIVAGTAVAGTIVYLRKKRERMLRKAISDKTDAPALQARSRYAMG